ncbi:hypothetical protein AGLY_015529 [Aphis glycines]|uniref:Uncharacterized protein n=1 Tax=Aphis glycines TaxID=307491 RepID=A0A6G0T0X0_APHGL|nr:hypothetical protein AGLY_015529 [Aphis glycines]
MTNNHKTYIHVKKVGKWVPLCCTLGGGVDLGLGIYNLYFLNNNKYQKSFEAKPLFNAVLKIYGEPCTKFLKLSYKRKNVYDFPTTKLFANFRNFDIFQQIIRNLVLNFQDFLDSQKIFIFLNYNHIKNRFGRKLDFRKNSRFSVIFFFVFLDFFENCWKMFTFYLYNTPRIFTFPSETTPEI